jgi:hypothetical protein
MRSLLSLLPTERSYQSSFRNIFQVRCWQQMRSSLKASWALPVFRWRCDGGRIRQATETTRSMLPFAADELMPCQFVSVDHSNYSLS